MAIDLKVMTMQKNSRPLIVERVKEYFNENGIKYNLNDDGDTAYLKYKFGKIVVEVSVICFPTFYVIHINYPFVFPKEKISKILVEINAINTRLPFGSFEMIDGYESVRYKDGIYTAERITSIKEFEDQFNLVLYFAEKYIDELEDLTR